MGLYKSFKPTNILQNANFETAVSGVATGWAAGTNITYKSVANNEQFFTGGGISSGTSNNWFCYANALPITNNKYYIRIRAKQMPEQEARQMELSTYYFALIRWDLSGTFTDYSYVYNKEGTNNHNFALTATASLAVAIKKAFVINLTAEGLPADILTLSDANLKAWCDLNLPSWFEGKMSGGRISGRGGLR